MLTSELDAIKQRIHSQKRKRTDSSEHLPEEISERLDAVEEKVARVSELCAEINNKIGEQQRRELATFKEQVTSNLTCTICRDIWSPPVRMAQCCDSILGCDPCVRQWMADNTTCPHCNTDDATTLIVRGLDGLIDLIKE